MADRARRGPVDARLLRRARATRTFLVVGVAIGSLTAVLVVGQAWLLSRTITSVFETRSTAGVGGVVGVLAAILLARAGLAWVTSVVAQRSAAAVKSQLRTDIMAARLAVPDGGAPSSALVTLVTQGLDALDGYFSKYLPQLVLAVTVPAIVGAAILFADWQAAAILAVTLPLIPLFMALVGWHTESLVKRRWAYQTRLARHFADLVAGLPTLQVFGRAKAQARGLLRTEDANRSETMKTLRVSFLSALVLELLSTLAVAVIAVTVGTRLVYFQIDFPTALFVLILAPEVYLPVRQVGVHYHDSADGVAAAETAFAEIDRASSRVGGDLQAPELVGAVTLQIEAVGHSYPGTVVAALAPVSFTVEPGEVVALAGASGGGKSTLVSALLGFLAPSAGRVLVGGVDLAEIEPASWRRQVAFVPQVSGLVAGTVGDNVRLGFPGASAVEARAALDRAGGADLELDQAVADEGEGLSAGERRRVAVARALLRIERGDARLLVLDEPTAGLDMEAEAAVLAAVRESGAAALVVSHRPAVLAAADRVIDIIPPTAPTGENAQPSPPAALTPASTRASSPAGSPLASTRASSPAGSPLASTPAGPASSRSPISTAEGPTAEGPTAEGPTAEGPTADGVQGVRGLVGSMLTSVPGGRARLALAVVLAAAASAASVGLMGVAAWLISAAALHPHFQALAVAAVGVRFFGISRGVLRYVERLVGHDLALRMQSALRLKTYGVLARTTLLGRRRGDLLVRVVADVEAIQDVVVRVVLPFAAAAFVMVATAGILGAISAASAGVLVVSTVAAGLLLPWWAQRLSRAADAAAAPLRGELADRVHEIARTAPDLVANGADRAALDRLAAADSRLRTGEQSAAWSNGLAAGGQVLAAGVAVLGALLIGSRAVEAEQIHPVLLAVLVLTPLALHEVMGNLAQSAQTLTRARTALDRVLEVLNEAPVGRGDVPASPAGELGGITLAGVAAGWPGHPPVVTDVSMTLRPGEKVAVVGPSGVGKTTLAATIMGLIPPLAGTLSVTARVGYLAQDAHIFATSLAENVRIGNKDATDAHVTDALRRAGLTLDATRVVGELGASLSGGEARRLAFARLLVGDYGLLILDEPTEHLDRETSDALMADVWAEAASRPVLVLSHDAEVIARCDRVLDLAAYSPATSVER